MERRATSTKPGWCAAVTVLAILSIAGCGSSSSGAAAVPRCADLEKPGARMVPQVAHGEQPCIDATGQPALQHLTFTRCGEEEHIWHLAVPDVWWSSSDWVVHPGTPPPCKS